MADVKRTLTAEYIKDGKRLPAGTEVTLSSTAFKKAIKAGVVHEDDDLNAEVPKLSDGATQETAQGQNVDSLLANKQQSESPTPAPGKVKT
jgi:hypothetical protein